MRVALSSFIFKEIYGGLQAPTKTLIFLTVIWALDCGGFCLEARVNI